MGVITLNVGTSILAAVIYDVGKVCLGRFVNKSNMDLELIQKTLDESLTCKYQDVLLSGEFENFISSTWFKDVIEDFIIYTITGDYNSAFVSLKKESKPLLEKDIVNLLTVKVLDSYDKNAVSKPEKSRVKKFFEEYFSIAKTFVVDELNNIQKAELYFINSNINVLFENLLLRVDTITAKLNSLLEVDDFNYDVRQYSEIVSEYHKLLLSNHSRALIYLLDSFDFSKFYVPPKLIQHTNKCDNDTNMGNPFLQNDWTDNTGINDWKYIFDYSNVVYITGGAGYGKSLFLKKIINDYRELNILSAEEYLVIYGDLKGLVSEGEGTISVLDYLHSCMIKETLIDTNKVTKELVDYYLKSGRCIILLDALDEVEKTQRADLHRKIVSFFKNQNPNNKICITSRNRGFIPEKEIEWYEICELDRNHIERYLDNIIKLGKFNPKDKDSFLRQSNTLMKKGFLNSFLVLSLLINIYKAERELPENKMELYDKCFNYIAYKREKEKTKTKFDWDLILAMMKENTFIELAQMCFPNNSDIGKEEIVSMLCKIYSKKYKSEVETEKAALDFLNFCGDRTELFVPAAGEDRYKFFHRSFFEYFYAQYIFYRVDSIMDIYKRMSLFDVDSEVQELTIAMMKQKNEMKYQQLIDYIFDQAESVVTTKNKTGKINAINILTLGMQVIDDNEYRNRYINIFVNEYTFIKKNIDKICNQSIGTKIICENKESIECIDEKYCDVAERKILTLIIDMYVFLKDIGVNLVNNENSVPWNYVVGTTST